RDEPTLHPPASASDSRPPPKKAATNGQSYAGAPKKPRKTDPPVTNSKKSATKLTLNTPPSGGPGSSTSQPQMLAVRPIALGWIVGPCTKRSGNATGPRLRASTQPGTQGS